MDNDVERRDSHLFMLRMWDEELAQGEVERRIRVQHVLSGETHYFRDWQKVVDYLHKALPERSQLPLPGYGRNVKSDNTESEVQEKEEA